MTDITAELPGGSRAGRAEYPIKRIIFASGLGTMIEWYDFYIFGSLAAVMSALLFPGKDPTWDLIKTWALFATGFLVRPFGAIVFGRIGDLIGRKYAFMVTLSIMGLSTLLIGLLPTYAAIGYAAPIVLLVLLGATAGQGIVWYTGQFYALSFMQSVMKVDIVKSSTIVALAVLFGMPFFTVFGALSDRIGRLKIMMAGNLIAALTYLPIYHAMKDHAGDPKNPNMLILIGLVFVQVIYVTMVYGPIAAFLIESFPAKIRYTSFSLPYHLGNGWFGGTLPLIAGLLVVRTGNIFAGLYWVIGVALMTFIVGSIFLNERHRVEIWAEAEEARPS